MVVGESIHSIFGPVVGTTVEEKGEEDIGQVVVQGDKTGGFITSLGK